MNALRNVYIDKDNYDLMVVIENPEDYNAESIAVAKEILAERQLDSEDLRVMALKINAGIAAKKLKDFNPTSSKIELHESYFLDAETIKEIYLQKFKELIDRKDALRFDSFIYAIGG